MQKEIVLLHGWGMNRLVWQFLEKELEKESKRSVKSLDLPGFGYAQMPNEPYSLAAAAKMIAAQLEDNSTLIGWSLGGLFALHLAKYFGKVGSKQFCHVLNCLRPVRNLIFFCHFHF